MSIARYALGVGALVCVLGSLGAGAVALRSFTLAQWRGAPARLAEVVLGLGLLIVTLQVLGTVGLFRLTPIVAASLGVGLGLRAWLPARAADDRVGAGRKPRPRSGHVIAVGLSASAAAVVVAEWAGLTLQSFGGGIMGNDSIAYHLPWAASFAQTGQITGIRYTDIDWLTGFYPATSELIHGLGIVLMGNDVLSPGINLVWLALVLLAAWCVGHPRGLSPATLLAGALAMALPMMFFSTAGSADNDVVGMFFLLAAVALWINVAPLATPAAGAGFSPSARGRLWSNAAPLPTPAAGGQSKDRQTGSATFGQARQISPAVLNGWTLLPAAIAAGLAISVKLNLLVSVLALSAAVIASAPSGCRGRVTRLWLAGVGAAGGYWYVRNLFAVGNPLPYFSFGVLPTPHPPPAQAHNSFSVANYLGHPRIVRNVLAPALAHGLGPWWLAIILVAVIGSGLCVVLGPDRLVRLIGLVALVSLGAYLFTPGSASGPWGHPHGFYFNLRYAAPALIVALTAAPLAAPLTGRRIRWVVLGGLVSIFAASVAQASLWGPGYSLSGQVLTAGMPLLGGAIVLLRRWWAMRSWPAVGRTGFATATLMLMLAGAAAGYGGQRHYLRERYVKLSGLPSVSDMWRLGRSVRHQRIALAGTFGWYFGYPLYGVDDSNHVVYLGHHGPHGSFRPIATCRAWRNALNAGHYRYVVSTATRITWTGSLVSSPEGDWTRTDPAARLVFPHAGGPVDVYKLTGRLNPAGCKDGSHA